MILRNFHKQIITLALTKMPKKVNSNSGKAVDADCPSGSKKSTSKAIQRQHQQNQQVPVAKSPVIQTKDGNFSISIQVRPGAKTNSVTGISDEAVSIQIAAPPVDGEANTAIVKYFAEILKIKKTEVSLKGNKSRQKTIIVESNASSSNQLTAGSILELLSAEVTK